MPRVPRGADTDGGGGGGARWACYGDVEESPLADPLRGRTLWGAPEAAAMPPPARPVAAAAARWHVEDQPRVNRTRRRRPHVHRGVTRAEAARATRVVVRGYRARGADRGARREASNDESSGRGERRRRRDSTGVTRVPTHPATPAAVVVKTEVESEVDVEREGTYPAAGGPSSPSNLADVLERERVGGEEDPDGYDDRDEPGVDPSLDGGHLRLRADKRASGWRVVADPGSIAARALESRKRRRDAAAADVNGVAGGTGVQPVRFKKGPGAALDASAAPASLALVDTKQTVLLQHYDPEWAANLDPKVKESIRPLRYVGCAIRDPHEKAPESESAYGVDVKQAAVTDPTNNGSNGNVDLHFRMDVGPGSVTQALKDAAPASEEEPVIFELPPFTSKDHAGRFVLAFPQAGDEEGLVHFRPPGGDGGGDDRPVQAAEQAGRRHRRQAAEQGPAAPPQTQPPTQAELQQQQQQQQQQQRVLQQQSLDPARAPATEMQIHQGGLSNS